MRQSGASLFHKQHILSGNPCGNELETFPLPNDPDRKTITVDLQGTSKLDFHLDLCLRLSEQLKCCRECMCLYEKLQFHQRLTAYTAMRAFQLLIEDLFISSSFSSSFCGSSIHPLSGALTNNLR